MRVDIFCQAIDFWGDAAVSWRAARAIKRQQPNWQISYFCDNWQIWQRLTGMPWVPVSLEGIILKDYTCATYAQADVSIEMLACTLPEHYPTPQCIINLEYLTAEDWILSCHLGQSYPLKKFFFFPGFFYGTGGLVYGDFFEQQVNPQVLQIARQQWCVTCGLSIDPTKKWVSCYLYQLDFQRLHLPEDTILIGPQPVKERDIVPDYCYFTPMRLAQYDALLWLCDTHLVRGEDSLSRAILTGKPFLWQAYRQQDGTQDAKIEALITQICADNAETYEALKQYFMDLNRQNNIDWPAWSIWQKKWAACFRQFRDQVYAIGSLESHLCDFILKQVGEGPSYSGKDV